MLRTWLIVGIVIPIVGLVSAQGPAPAPSASPEHDGPQRQNAAAEVGIDEASYIIEMRVIEGGGLIGYEAQRTAMNLPRSANSGAAHRPTPAPEVTAALAARSPAILPNPPERDALQAQGAKSADEGWWDDSLPTPGITVLAAPRVTLVAKQQATVQIQTQQIFSYMEPLGDGTFEVKHTAPQALGMTFTLEVQPVEGDAESIDLAPLEIQLSALDGREAVEGLDLDVGKPIIATRSLKTTARMKLGATRVIAIPSGPNTEAVLVVRVKLMDLP